jgi:hypothetical protein
MKVTLQILAITLASFLSTNANAWFFFFIPGSVVGAIGDAITGSEGDTCVAETAKIGDTFRSPNGNVATIKSLSGTSSRCAKAELPIRALVEYSMSSSFSSKAGIDLPEGYAPKSLTNLQRFNGYLLLASHNATDSGVLVTSTKRDVISEMTTYVTNLRPLQVKALDDAQQSEIEQLTINGMKAWRYETAGKAKNLFGTRYTYQMTVLEGAKEVLAINAWTTSGNYDERKAELSKLAWSVSGVEVPPPPVDLAKEAEAKRKVAEEEAGKLAAEEDAKRIAAEEEDSRIAIEAAEKQAKGVASMKNGGQAASKKLAASSSHQLDFNIEANKAARILGCRPLEVKVTGTEGGDIQYRVVCDGSKTLNLSCDPTGLCLKKKAVAGSKQ